MKRPLAEKLAAQREEKQQLISAQSSSSFSSSSSSTGSASGTKKRPRDFSSYGKEARILLVVCKQARTLLILVYFLSHGYLRLVVLLAHLFIEIRSPVQSVQFCLAADNGWC